MTNIQTILILIPALPLVATLVCALFGPWLLKGKSHWPVVLAIGASFVLSLMLLAQVKHAAERAPETSVGWETTVDLWQWATIPDAIPTPLPPREGLGEGESTASSQSQLPANLPFTIAVTLRADALTAIMLSMVTFVSLLVAIYASGYMHGDRGYWRFFTYIALFVFSMTMLVSVSNFVLLYVFWEAVGACSYLLIGYWYEKPEAAAAGKKAFLVNRIGDFGFALGVFLIWTTYGTLNFHDAGGIAGVLGQTRLANPELFVTGTVATAICLLLMLGACGKSAQFPLHVWLPDAMEGPTPVSALIHAATMVTAGVYMVARCTPLFHVSVDAQQVVAGIGGLTAILAAVIAITQTDLKRVLAYSTVSQLGFMFLALGAGSLAGIVAGMFHLFTHAFFKALLFLGAGSVMHAMGGVIDVRRFGGLRRLMPTTHWTFLCGALALAGVLPFAGFWSKDAILAAVHDRAAHAAVGQPLFNVLFYVALLTSFLTALYTFRAFFLTFYGDERVPREAGHHAHESPPSMTVPLMILAVGAIGVGGWLEATGGFRDLLGRTPSLAYSAIQSAEEVHKFHFDIAAISTVVALAGVGAAAFFYLGGPSRAERLAAGLAPLYKLSHGKLFFDEIYQALFVRPLALLANLSYLFDRWVVDGLVNLCGLLPPAVGSFIRVLQNGLVQFYALAMVLGLLVLIGTLLLQDFPIVQNLLQPPNLLLTTIGLPLAGAAWIWIIADKGKIPVRQSAFVTSVITLVLAVLLLKDYPGGTLPYGAVELRWLDPWPERSGIDVRLSVGLDGLSVWLFGLTALLMIPSVLVSWEAIDERPGTFYALLLLLESGMLGVFAARDIIFFYICFEFTLIPLFFLIGIWGSEQRRYAAIKFFLFTLAGSVITFLGLLAIVLWNYNHSADRVMTFSIPRLTAGLAQHPMPLEYQVLIFVALFAGFAIKVPLFPLHTWLPLAHVQAPTAGSVILAGVLLKIGTYGFLRFNLPMLPDATAACAPWLLWLSVIGIIYGALVALAQSDMKRLIAYSSVSHLGYCMLGLFALNSLSLQGSLLQMVNHGLSTGGLFALVGMIYERYHTREIRDLGGLARRTPWLAFFLVLFTFSSIGLPGLNGFVGEFLILLGMFQRASSLDPSSGLALQYQVIAVLGVFGVVLGAWYMLWLVQRILFGPLREPSAALHDHAPHDHASHNHPVRDMSGREMLALAPLAVFIFWIGLAPKFFLEQMAPSVDRATAAAAKAFDEQSATSAIGQLRFPSLVGRGQGRVALTGETPE